MCPVNIQGSTNEEKKENGYSAMVLVFVFNFWPCWVFVTV